MTLHTTKVIKAKNKFMHKRYVYRMNRSMHQIVYWLCEQNIYQCNGRITMKNGIITKRNPHNHGSDVVTGKQFDVKDPLI